MSALSRASATARARGCSSSTRPTVSSSTHLSLYRHGRSISYTRQRLYPRNTETRSIPLTHPHSAIYSPFLLPTLPPSSVAPSLLPLYRQFHNQPRLWQEARPNEDIKQPPRKDSPASNTEPSSKTTSSAPPGQQTNSQEDSQGGQNNSEKEGASDGGEGETESKAKDEKEKKKDAPPPPHGDKSPMQVFMDTLKTEFKASKEWNESTKALASSAHDFTQNQTIQSARRAYGAASGAASTTTSKVLKTTGKAIGQSAAWTWDTSAVKGIRAGANATGRGLEKLTRPVRETDAYKSVRDVIDDGSSSRYGGWAEKEQRRKRREERELKEAARTGRPLRRAEKIEEDPDAGTNVTLHKDAAWKESWRTFRDSNKVMQSFFSLKSTYNESENPLISTARSISDRVAGFFAENETAMVIKKFREIDPNFQLEPFLQDMREYILPEVLDAYVKGDVETLKLWLSAAQFQVYSALMHQYKTAGLKSDGRILDIRNVDVLSARILDPGEIPVFILTCRTQEVHVYRNQKTQELAAGMEDRVQQVTYAIGVTRIPEDVNNPETRGWRLIELQKSSRDYH